jgi:hypothetical protein
MDVVKWVRMIYESLQVSMLQKGLGQDPTKPYTLYHQLYIAWNLQPHLGSLHTWAKSRDHEIVRAQKKVTKGRPKTPPKSCSVKSYVTGP